MALVCAKNYPQYTLLQKALSHMLLILDDADFIPLANSTAFDDIAAPVDNAFPKIILSDNNRLLLSIDKLPTNHSGNESRPDRHRYWNCKDHSQYNILIKDSSHCLLRYSCEGHPHCHLPSI